MLCTETHPFSWQNVLKEWVVEAELKRIRQPIEARMVLYLI